MKPYQHVPIQESMEPLAQIPIAAFAIESPHPYVKLGAPYGDKSPYYLRQGVLERLLSAQAWLQQQHPHWRIQIFDAYRPIPVQQFMVDYSFQQALQAEGLALNALSESQHRRLWEKVHQFWAAPSLDPKTPPPHSTGAALDITLVDGTGQVVDMGSPIDEMSPRSYPDYFAPTCQGLAGSELAESDQASDPFEQVCYGQVCHENERAKFHQNRLLLREAMTFAGFEQHPKEWWHFSYGDQLWAWLTNQKQADRRWIACYGAI
jgi:D-alanyl-D-alanine dipeptidase